MEKGAIKLFENKKVRVEWDDEKEKWYFSIVDIVAVLTDQEDFQVARKYWNKLSQRLREEGSEAVSNCHRLKLRAEDGKLRETDVADTEVLLRIIQSIPSPKAEPFKIWLAKVGNERIDETHDPELAIDRAMQTYLKKGYSKEWINQRIKTIEVRKELTDEWERVGIQEDSEFAILTDEITKAWSDLSIKDYKNLKNLKKENLRDIENLSNYIIFCPEFSKGQFGEGSDAINRIVHNMTNLELVLNMLAEVTTKEISKKEDPAGFPESLDVARKGGSVAGNTRKEIESMIGKPVVSEENFLEISEKEKKKKKRLLAQVSS